MNHSILGTAALALAIAAGLAVAQTTAATHQDVTARLMHGVSARRERPFVHVDCAALPKDLIEAELFGHEKGAFTSAHVERTGLIEAAEDGKWQRVPNTPDPVLMVRK